MLAHGANSADPALPQTLSSKPSRRRTPDRGSTRSICSSRACPTSAPTTEVMETEVGADGKNSRNNLCRRDSRRQEALRDAADTRRPGRGVGYLPGRGDLDNNCFRARLRRRVSDHRPTVAPQGTTPGDRRGPGSDGLVRPCGDIGAESGREDRHTGDLAVDGFDIGPGVPRRGGDRAACRGRFRPAGRVRGGRGGLGLHRVRRAAARPTVDAAPRQRSSRARVHRRDLHRRTARAARRRRRPERPAVDGRVAAR